MNDRFLFMRLGRKMNEKFFEKALKLNGLQGLTRIARCGLTIGRVGTVPPCGLGV